MKKLKKVMGVTAVLLAVAIAVPAFAAALPTPTLAYVSGTPNTITLAFTAGGTPGAPAGFTVQWKPAVGFTGDWTDCHWASFQVPVSDPKPFMLGAGQSVTVVIGIADSRPVVQYSSPAAYAPLSPAAVYVFRAVANAVSGELTQSDYTSPLHGLTLPAEPAPSPTPGTGNGQDQRHGKGYWKHQLTTPGTSASALGATTFFNTGMTWAQILKTPPKGGDTYYKLAQSYITALLNAQRVTPVPAQVQQALSTAAQYFATATPGVRANTAQGKVNLRLAAVLNSWGAARGPDGL